VFRLGWNLLLASNISKNAGFDTIVIVLRLLRKALPFRTRVTDLLLGYVRVLGVSPGIVPEGRFVAVESRFHLRLATEVVGLCNLRPSSDTGAKSAMGMVSVGKSGWYCVRYAPGLVLRDGGTAIAFERSRIGHVAALY
jgi:hypothetical protein